MTDEAAVGYWECVLFAESEDDPGQEDPSEYGVSELSELFNVTFNPDHTAELYAFGEELGKVSWHIEDSGELVLETGDDVVFKAYYFQTGNLEIDLYFADAYIEFYCSKD